MKKTVKLSFNGTTVERNLGSRAENNPTFRANRINALKRGFVEKFAIQQMLSDGIISEENLVINEAGQKTHHLLNKSVSQTVIEQFEKLVEKFAAQVIVE